jgi:flagellar hook-associated protein 3 FlgL
MRVTEQGMIQTMLFQLRQRLSSIDRYQTNLATARRIQVPSDDPNGTARAMQIRSRLAANQQYQRNVFDAESWLERTDAVITNIHDAVLQVRDYLQQGASDTLGADERLALAAQVDAALEDVILLANTRYGGRFLFTGVGGSGQAVETSRTVTAELFTAPAADQPQELDHAGLEAGSVIVKTLDGLQTFVEGDDYVVDYDLGTITVLSSSTSVPPMTAGTTYQVDYETLSTSTVTLTAQASGVPMLRQVGQDKTYDIVIGAVDVFDEDLDVFQTLIDARDALERNDRDAISAAYADVEQIGEQVLQGNERAGSILQRLRRAEEDLADTELTLVTELSTVEETDMAEAILALQREEVTYQTILEVISRSVVEPSLLRFLD